MENLKKFLGNAYKEGITLEEIDAFLQDKKFVNLAEGNYVDKDKYNKVVAERDSVKTSFDELTAKTKDYESIKSENETFKSEKADNILKEKLVALGMDSKSFKYVKSDINDKLLVLTENDDENKAAVTKYLEENPQFAVKGNNPKLNPVLEKYKMNGNFIGNGPKTVSDKSWNKNRGI